MAHEAAHLAHGTHVPEANPAILAGAEGITAVRRKADGMDRRRVFRQLTRLLREQARRARRFAMQVFEANDPRSLAADRGLQGRGANARPALDHFASLTQ